MFLLCFSRNLRVGSRDYFAPRCCTALKTWVTTPFPLAGWKPAEVSSTLSFGLGTVYKSPSLEAEGSRQLGWHLLPPQTLLKKRLGAWMPTHRTDSCSHGLRVMAMQLGRTTCGFSSDRQYAQRHDRVLGYFKFSVSNYFIALMNLLQHSGCVCSPDTQHRLCLQSWIRDLSVFCVLYLF